LSQTKKRHYSAAQQTDTANIRRSKWNFITNLEMQSSTGGQVFRTPHVPNV